MSRLRDAMALAERSTRLTHSVALGEAPAWGRIDAFAVHVVEMSMYVRYLNLRLVGSQSPKL